MTKKKTVWVLFEDFYEVAEQSFRGVFTSRERGIKFIKDIAREEGEPFDEQNWFLREVSLDEEASLD